MKVASKLFLRLHTDLHTDPCKLPASEIDFFKKCFTTLKLYGHALWPEEITQFKVGSNPTLSAIFYVILRVPSNTK